MFYLRLAWLVVAYPMQVNKFDFDRVSFKDTSCYFRFRCFFAAISGEQCTSVNILIYY
jgi:hypothetical protein